MGQLVVAGAPAIGLTPVDRLVASNADGGLATTAAHVILLGESAGRNLDASNVIALGFNALRGGNVGLSGPDVDFSTVVGEQSFVGPADLTTGKLQGLGAVTIIGGGNYAAMTTSRRMAGLICVGAGIAPDFDGVNDGGMDRSILIGNSIFDNNTLDNAPSSGNVIIGHRACRRASLNGQATQYTENTIIGELGGPQVDSGATMTGNTAVGSRTLQNFLGPGGENTVLGRRACAGLTSGTQNIVIGANSDLGGNATDTVVIGANTAQGASDQSIYLGANQSNGFTSDRNIVIGFAAGRNTPAGNSDVFLVETYDGITQRTLLAGDIDKGALIVGRSNPATNRDLPGTNLLKLITGTYTGVAPVGGGIFYYDAATGLHFVGAGGADTVLAPP